MLKLLATTVTCMLYAGLALSDQTEDYRLVDLSHAYDDDTLYWPTSPTHFEKDELAYGETPGGWFYSAFSVSTPEHGGTHLDAPIHFHADGMSTEQIPLQNLVGNAVVIDVTGQAAADRNYRLTVDDVLFFEKHHGRIRSDDIVLMRTDWDQFWPDAKGYLGDDTAGDASNLQFPGYGAEATRLLVEDRGVRVLGIDTASIDFGKSQDFIAHRIGAAQNVSNLENLTNLRHLPPTGATVIALPMKITGGSGGPARVIAMIPN